MQVYKGLFGLTRLYVLFSRSFILLRCYFEAQLFFLLTLNICALYFFYNDIVPFCINTYLMVFCDKF